jgi:hypothetical protein
MGNLEKNEVLVYDEDLQLRQGFQDRYEAFPAQFINNFADYLAGNFNSTASDFEASDVLDVTAFLLSKIAEILDNELRLILFNKVFSRVEVSIDEAGKKACLDLLPSLDLRLRFAMYSLIKSGFLILSNDETVKLVNDEFLRVEGGESGEALIELNRILRLKGDLSGEVSAAFESAESRLSEMYSSLLEEGINESVEEADLNRVRRSALKAVTECLTV